jgi:putative ABC transport system permease protein
MMDILLRLALLLAPREFRAQYGAQIAADAQNVRFVDILDVALTGLRLRADEFGRDVSYAVRRLMKSPMFVTIVALTFALGIGANIAVFSVLNAVVLRPLPYLNATRLVTVGAKDSRRATHPALSILDVDDLRSQTHTLSQIAAGTPDQLTIAAHGRPIALNGIAVMPEYFELLGIRPQLGRNLTPADSRPGEQRLVISDAVWRGDFGADPAVIGRAIVVNGTAMRIVGVLAPGQLLVDPAERKIGPQDYITALPETDRPNQRGSRYLGAVAQIAPSASLASVNAELALVSQRLQKQYPGTDATFTFSAQSMHAAVLGSAASIVWIVFAAVVGILLIACANVGNMLIARWSTRDRELALRRSLGASSSSIARMLLIETGILAVVGAVLGIGLAYAGLRAVGSFALSSLPRGGDVAIDGPALLYAVAIVVVTTFLAALAPIASLNVTDLNSVLKAAGRGGDASARHRSRTSLVVFEIALALALVIVSGLMVRSFIELIRTPLGIRQAGVVVSDFVSLPNNYASLDARAAAQQRVLEQLRSLPGVQTAALGVNYPLGGISLNFDTSVLGKNYPQGEEPSAAGNDVTPGYFRSLGIPLVRGRDFTSNDTAHSLPVVIVNQSFARTVLSDREAIGAKIRIAGWNGTNAHWASVVGVVADTRLALAQAPASQYYVPLTQAPPTFFSAIVYAAGTNPAMIGREIRTVFSRVLPTLQAPDTFTFDDLAVQETMQKRAAAALVGMLALVALLIALAGVFGVVSSSVTQRSREFGVRMALGSTTRAILADVLRRTIATTAIGVAVGVVVAASAARAIASQLGSVSPFDPLIFCSVVALIFVCAALASLQPALRATRIQPVDALRYE